jgi:RND family efflux transporter MFP subunit
VTRLTAGLLLAAATLGCGKKPAEEVATSEAVEVEVEAATVGAIQAVIVATGVVDPAPGADWTILAPGPARIAELPRAEGDRVEPGDLLVRFDAPGLRSDASTKAAESRQAEARLENARQNHERLTALLAKGIAARKEVEDARRERLDAEAALEGARAAAADAGGLAASAVVRARFAGVVAKRWHNPGDMLDGAAGDPVLRVIDPSRLQVLVAVPVADLGRIVVGHGSRLKQRGSASEAWDGRVLGTPAAVDPATGTATVRVSAPPGLAAGTPVQVEILAEDHPTAVIVPATAVVRQDDEPVVFVVGSDGKAHRREVRLGIENLEQVEIEHGLAAGENVVVVGNEGLPDGAAVTIESPAP